MLIFLIWGDFFKLAIVLVKSLSLLRLYVCCVLKMTVFLCTWEFGLSVFRSINMNNLENFKVLPILDFWRTCVFF